MSPKAVLEQLEKRKMPGRCQDLNGDFFVVHPVAWSLSCRVRAFNYQLSGGY